MCKAEKTHLDNRVDIRLLQVAYETELSGTPTAVFTEIQLIGQFLVLDIIIIVVILASQKVIWSHCYVMELSYLKSRSW